MNDLYGRIISFIKNFNFSIICTAAILYHTQEQKLKFITSQSRHEYKTLLTRKHNKIFILRGTNSWPKQFISKIKVINIPNNKSNMLDLECVPK